MEEFPVSLAKGNEYAFYCITCKKNVFCNHVKRHMKLTTFINMTKAITDNQKVSDMFAPSTRKLSYVMQLQELKF